MYIRSQDKRELVEFHGSQIACLGGIYYIRPLNMDFNHSIGNYSSKERCIAVLDEIQHFLDVGAIIFEMPKE